jgi:hypothetical protein
MVKRCHAMSPCSQNWVNDFDIYSLFQCVHDILIVKSFKFSINDQNVDFV